MYVTLSERKLSERIRELEGIQDSVEEITDRISHYASRLFGHIANYGVRMQGMVSQSGGLGTFRFSLDPIWDEEDRSTRIQGLSQMNPNSCTVEAGDLPGLVPQGTVRTMLEDEFHTYSHELAKVVPSDISPTLERIALRVMNQPSSVDFGDASTNEEYLQQFLARSGKKDPLAKLRAQQEFEREELARAEAADKARFEMFIANDGNGE